MTDDEIVKVELITKIKYKGEEHNLQELFNYLVEQLEKKDNIIKEAINYIKEESWFCYKDNEEVIDRTPVEKLLEILGDNDENI